LSEYGLFKLCVNNPQVIDKQLSKLNLTFIKDLNNSGVQGKNESAAADGTKKNTNA